MNNPATEFITASTRHLRGCPMCMALTTSDQPCCANCHTPVHSRNKNSLQVTVALLITSLILYIPANLLPIMYTNYLGAKVANTIVGGVLTLWSQGSYPIAIIIFVASVFVPVGKILALGWLCYTVKYNKVRSHQRSHELFRLTEFIGKWSMVDIFVVTVLVALIQMGNFMSILPGEAAIAFGALVITTMLAAFAFDSRLIWEPLNMQATEKQERNDG